MKSGVAKTILGGGCLIGLLSILLTNTPALADPISTTSSTDLNVSIAEVISLQVTSPCANNGNLVLNITPTPTGSITTCQNIIRVDTNTPGYSLSFKSSSSSLTHTSITSPTTPTIPPTNNGTTPAQLDLNSWGFAIPNKTLNGYGAFDTTYTQRTNAALTTTNDKYATTPTTDTEIAKLDTGNANNNTVVVNANTAIFYGASADMDLTAGAYVTTLIYTAIGELIPEPVGPAGASMFLTISGSGFMQGSSVLVDGYYCVDAVIRSDTLLTCSTKSVTGPSDANVVVTEPPIAEYNFIGADGGRAQFACSALSTPQFDYNGWINDTTYTKIVKDTRNGQDYRVRKLPDGKCWMIDNLKLSGATLNSTNTDTNISYSWTFPANPVARSSWSGLTYSILFNLGNGSCNGTYDTSGYYVIQLSCSGSGTVNSAGNAHFVAWADPTASSECSSGLVFSEESLTGCGYYYNWYTATAMTGVYNLTAGSNASKSICPAGWRLPIYGSSLTDANNDFSKLNAAMYNGSSVPSSASDLDHAKNWWPDGMFSGTLTGYYSAGFQDQGSGAYYWTSSAENNSTAFYFKYNFDSVGVSGLSSVGKLVGTPVRCLQ